VIVTAVGASMEETLGPMSRNTGDHETLCCEGNINRRRKNFRAYAFLRSKWFRVATGICTRTDLSELQMTDDFEGQSTIAT